MPFWCHRHLYSKPQAIPKIIPIATSSVSTPVKLPVAATIANPTINVLLLFIGFYLFIKLSL